MCLDFRPNLIKLWLQKNGERTEEGFTYKVNVNGVIWKLFLGYSYNETGWIIEPTDICITENINPNFIKISDRHSDDLDDILKELNIIDECGCK